MTMPGEVTVQMRDGWVVARLAGEVDMTNAEQVGEELTRDVGNEAKGLIVDVSSTRYIDSAGIGVLFAIARRLRGRRQSLRLVVPPSSPLVRVLEITEVQAVASLHGTLDHALAEDP